MPNGIHEWAQADRLALAYGYYDNGMNFFKPTTFSQFSKDGVTGVEFPIQAYLTALLSKFIGRDALSIVFKSLNISLVLSGIILLFSLIREFTNNTLSSIFPLSFLLFSPVFLFYTCNYLADSVSAIWVMVAMTLFLQAWMLGKYKRKYFGAIIFTFAALIKTSSTLYFIGFVFYDLLRFFFEKKGSFKKERKYFLIVFTGFALIVGYFFYNDYLNITYDSNLFLLHILLPTKDMLLYLLNDRLPNVLLQEYFFYHSYWFIILVVVLSYFKKSKLSLKIYLPLCVILLIGVFIVSYLMGAQFIDHDYYVIAIFFPWIYLSFFWFAIHHQALFLNRFFHLVLIALFMFFLIGTYQRFQDRISPDYPGFSEYYRTSWMEDGYLKLNRLQINLDEKIGVIQEDAPNLALLYFDRKGYVIKGRYWRRNFAVLSTFFKKHHLKIGLCNQKEFSELINTQPVFYKYFRIKYQDDKLVVFELL
ncbi:MAG: hypothetical protein M9887_00895 [Chitinophagales bacterium]|nr:hypothetical protein [Chitinophagales bacterium]